MLFLPPNQQCQSTEGKWNRWSKKTAGEPPDQVHMKKLPLKLGAHYPCPHTAHGHGRHFLTPMFTDCVHSPWTPVVCAELKPEMVTMLLLSGVAAATWTEKTARERRCRPGNCFSEGKRQGINEAVKRSSATDRQVTQSEQGSETQQQLRGGQCSSKQWPGEYVENQHSKSIIRPQTYLHIAKYTTTTILRPFVQDYLGEPVPGETLTHPLSWSSSKLYQLLPSTMIHSILLVQITWLGIFLHNLFPCPLWSTSWSGALRLIFHTFLHPISVFFSQHMPTEECVLLKNSNCWLAFKFLVVV